MITLNQSSLCTSCLDNARIRSFLMSIAPFPTSSLLRVYMYFSQKSRLETRFKVL